MIKRIDIICFMVVVMLFMLTACSIQDVLPSSLGGEAWASSGISNSEAYVLSESGSQENLSLADILIGKWTATTMLDMDTKTSGLITSDDDFVVTIEFMSDDRVIQSMNGKEVVGKYEFDDTENVVKIYFNGDIFSIGMFEEEYDEILMYNVDKETGNLASYGLVYEKD